MKYILSIPHPHQRYIHIEFIIENNQSKELVCQLPAWRPGRYELGNFAKNVKSFSVKDQQGNELLFNKISKDSWLIDTRGNQTITIAYDYYAADLNAGSTYLDEKQL